MHNIQQLSGTITQVIDLSPTAREYTIRPEAALPFVAGGFVNVFVTHNGETIRRAFSFSSSDTEESQFTLTIRHSLNGALTPLLWAEDFTGHEVKLMGPLGLNTADKMKSKKIFLFGFGVGAGVVKSLADSIAKRDELGSLTIITGNRSAEEILHQDYFVALANNNPKVTCSFVVSDTNQDLYPTGYIQDNIAGLDFNNADVYICGQEVACTALTEAVKKTNPTEVSFFIEDFH